ncbi:MAG: response regulator [Bradyrhizobiaceae bacterium]|nr:response regulator [Bradyrhizobiaceae bacterium]
MIYEFENFRLDADRRELRRGAELVALEPQVFDVLEYLIRNRERIVSKNDLIADVWDGRIVSDSTLSSRITAVRHAIGDSGEAQRLLRTVSRKGFRFVGEVREQTKLNKNVSATGAEIATSNQNSNHAPSVEDAVISAQLLPRPTKILIVDDHVLVREALHGVLRELTGPETTIVAAGNSRQAKQQLEQSADLQLVILDLGLPDQDGFELLREFCANNKAISTVVLSASHDRNSVAKALDLGARGFIPKSASREVMVAAFNLIFSGGIYIPPDILDRP